MDVIIYILLLVQSALQPLSEDSWDIRNEEYKTVTVFASDEGGIPIPDSISEMKVKIKVAFLLKTSPPSIEYLERETPATIILRPDFSYGFISKSSADGVLTAFVHRTDNKHGGYGMQADAIFIDNSGEELNDLKIHGHNALSIADSIQSNKTSDSSGVVPKDINIIGTDVQFFGWTNPSKLKIPFQAAFFNKTEPPSILFVEGQTPFNLKIEQDFHYAFFCTTSDIHYLMVCMEDLTGDKKKPGTCSEGKSVFIYNSLDKRYMAGSN